MRAWGRNLLAVLLGLYLALSMIRTAGGLMAETERAESIQKALSETEMRIDALERERNLTDEQVRVLAFRRWGLVSPGDVVFFDTGAWDGVTEPPKIKGG